MDRRAVTRMRLSEVAHWFGVTAPKPDAFVRGVCIDSRRVRKPMCRGLGIPLHTEGGSWSSHRGVPSTSNWR